MKKTKKVQISDIADSCGVSITTVSRVMNDRPYVKEEIKQRVLRRAVEMNYVPQVTARKDCIAVVIELSRGMSGGYEGELLRSLSAAVNSKGFRAEIMPVSDADFHFSGFVSGIISLLYEKESLKFISKIKNIPVICINTVLSGYHSICTDHYRGIRQAVDYLASCGHNKIGYIKNNSECWGQRERLRGFAEGMAANGVKDSEGKICKVRMDAIYEEENCSKLFGDIESFIKSGKFTALVLSSEGLALPVNHALANLNLKIPGDISVISLEQPGLSNCLTPPWTTIDQNLIQLADTAVEQMARVISGEKETPEIIMLQNKIIERESIKNQDLN